MSSTTERQLSPISDSDLESEAKRHKMTSIRKRLLSPISDSDLESEAKRHKTTSSKVDFPGNQGAKLVSSVSGQAMEEPMGAASNADTTCDAKSVGSTSQQVPKDIQIPDHILSQVREKYMTLKNAYKKQCPCQLRNIARSELVECQQYSSKQLTDDRGIGGKSIRLSYSSLFKGDQDRKEGGNTRILIVGEAGIGKTILCASIAEDWANGKLFQEFLMVFLIPLNQRGVASAQNLQDLLKYLEFDGEALATYLMENKKDNILMIADGWDKLLESDSSTESFLYRLLFGDLVPSSSLTVVVMSKSTPGPAIQQSISRFITVQGFSNEITNSYIQCEFSKNSEKLSFITTQLESNPLLGSICSVPLNLAMICSYFQSCDEPLPSTMPKLYEKLAWNLAQLKINNTREDENLLKLSNYRDLPNELQQSWLHLCQFAFEKFQADFSKVIASGCLSTELETFGLLKPAAVGSDEVMFSFLYPAFRYYLAVSHLTIQPPSEQLEVIKSMHQINPMFCRFYLSVSENLRSDIVSKVVQKLHHCCKDMCLLSFESKNEIVDREVAKSLLVSGSTIMLHAQNAYECVAMVHVLEKIDQPCNVEINFQNCRIKAPKLATVLGNQAKVILVKGLDLSDNGLSDVIIADFFSRASSAFGSLEKLFLRNCDIGEVGLPAIIDALANSSCESLTQLDLSFNSLSVACLECFQQHIDKDKINVQKLEILILKGSLAEDTNVNFLKSFAATLSTKCKHLRRLDLSGNKLDACNDPEFSTIVSQLTASFGTNFDLRLDDMSKVEENFLTIMEESIKNKGTIDHTIAHGVIVGPGRSGKDTLLKRLTGEGPPDPNTVSPSTGVLENVVKVEVKKLCAVASDKCNLKWQKLKYDEEALELMMTTAKNYSQLSDVPRPVTIKYIYQKKSMEDKKSSPLSSKTKSSKQDTPKADKPRESESATSNNTDSVEEESKHIVVYCSDLAPVDVFKKAMKLRRMDALREHLESSWSLYLTNTGGQIEFQEYLPLLVCGPSIFFVTFPLHHDLDKPYEVRYDYPDGSDEKYLSPSTLMEEILQTLATIYTLDDVTVQICDKIVTLKPTVFIIGTHRDCLKSETDKIAQIDGKIQRYVKQTSLCCQGSIQFASDFEDSDEHRLIFTVNNLSEGDDDFQKIRFAVQQTVEKRCLKEFTVRCPSSWLIFSLILREKHNSNRVLRFEDCFKIAQECGIPNQEELKIALSFIHSRLGLVRYFDIDGLNSLVVVDPQILFDKITRLIVETFSGENASHKEIEDFHNKGIISQPVMERISARSSEDIHDQSLLNTNHKKIKEFHKKGIISRAAMKRISESSSEDAQLPFTWLTKLLNHRRLAALFKDQYGEKYFFPSALCHVSKAQDPSAGSKPPNTLPQALIAFETGFCPRGIAGALIKCLMTNEMKSSQRWCLLPHKIFKNQVSFRIAAKYGHITLKIFPTHLEVSLDPEEVSSGIADSEGDSSEPETEDLKKLHAQTCEEAYMQIDKCMEDITTSLYRKCEYFWTFYCRLPECKTLRHPAVIEWDCLDKPTMLRCTISESLKRTRLSRCYQMWNIQKKHKGGSGVSLLDTEVKEEHIGVIAGSMSEWEGAIADALGLSEHDKACINENHNKNFDLKIREALHIWRRKNGSDATYSKLIEAFERADYKTYAEKVRRIVQPSNSKLGPSSEEHSQPQVYPASDKPQSLSQVPPGIDKPVTEVYKMREGTPPEEDGGAVCSKEVLDSQNVSFVPKLSKFGSKGDQDHSDEQQRSKLDQYVPEASKQSSTSPAEDQSISDSAQGPGMMLLDAEVQEKHIGMIADSMSEWEGRIAEELELNQHDIACIKEKYDKKLDLQIREALHTWRRKNGLGATYSKLIEAFEQANYKHYAEKVRSIVQPSNSKTGPSSEEYSQPPTYLTSDEPQSLSQVPPAMHKPTYTEVIEDRHSTSSLDSASESSVNESHPPQASLGASLQSIPTSHTPLGQQQTQATAATPTTASAPVATPTLATSTPAPQHNTALQRAHKLIVDPDAGIDRREYIKVSTEDVDSQSVLTQAASYNDYHSCGYPHIGLLRVDFNGILFYGTATMIADGRCLLTCAHIVVNYKKNTDQEPMYAKNMWFELRKNGSSSLESSSLVKQYKIHKMEVHPKYFDNPSPASGFDLALCWIEVPENDQHFETMMSTGIFPTLAAGVRHFTDKCKVAVVGFPAQAQNRNVSGEKWGMAAKVPMEQREDFCNEHRDCLIYNFIDTSAGQAGSPLIHIIMGQDSDSEYQYEIFGVHAGGSKIRKEKYATFITYEKLEWIVQCLGSPWKINSKGDPNQMYLAR